MRIIHTGDFFIGIQNFGKSVPTFAGFSQIDDYIKYLNFTIDYAISNTVDLILVSGNVFFSSQPSIFLQNLIIEKVQEAVYKKIKFIFVQGQYDQPYRHSSFIKTLSELFPDNVTAVVDVGVQKISIRDSFLQIACIPTPSILKHSLEESIIHLSNQIDPSGYSIFCSQLLLESFKPFFLLSHLQKFKPEILKNLVFNYYALGGYHIPLVQKHVSNPHTYIGYPGSLGEIQYGDSLVEKGFLFIDTKSKSKKPVFVRNKSQRLVTLIRITADTIDDIYEKLDEEFLLNDFKESITRIVIHTELQVEKQDIKQKYSSSCFYIYNIEIISKSHNDTFKETNTLEKFVEKYIQLKTNDLTEQKALIKQCLSYFVEADKNDTD
ncbi:MAG: hypothetical protein KAH01_01210 [Caldisericia bacterium]|nr:hypothetical protein [Caldisericia bacterium]